MNSYPKEFLDDTRDVLHVSKDLIVKGGEGEHQVKVGGLRGSSKVRGR